MLNDVSVMSENLTPCNMFRMSVYDYELQIWISVRFIAFLDTAVGKPGAGGGGGGGLTHNLFSGSYSHAHWVTSGAAAIVIK